MSFDTPTDIDDATMAFPANVEHLMPAYEDIPEEYRKGRSWANRMASEWFFGGIAIKSITWKVDGEKALRHLAAIQRSFQPQHEHKEAAVAYLLDLWTEGEAVWERN